MIVSEDVSLVFANKSRIPRDNLGRRCDFYEKAICCMLQVWLSKQKACKSSRKGMVADNYGFQPMQLTDEPAVKLNY